MELRIHPLADAFPMLSESELLELAQDIAKHGLRETIKLDSSGEILVDGRNRAAACAIAEVEPRYERLPEGTNLDAYVISANVERRHLNAGQKALAYALAQPEKGRGGRGRKLLQNGEVSSGRLSEAREIITHDDLAQGVMAGTVSFAHALAEARWRVKNAKALTRVKRELENQAPDLAAEVEAGSRSLYDALMEHERRQRAAKSDLKELRKAALQHLAGLMRVWNPRLAKDEAFRAGIIHELKVEPPQAAGVIAAVEQLVKEVADA